ncbi:amidohydrolase [Paenibacillus sp. OAS669]|uniref:amidohydrolase n=1 Tax=Paenibacillus sp. OAS669 TaxID=2663821 RepID=UPI001789D4CC|nr:amidohydrolase [Paenibacillus sp. OAS669]MBE1445356.1 amidohydrolase [Paenibacillus sp. OAS669]
MSTARELKLAPEQWLEEARALYPVLADFRRDLHRYPELSMQEVETTRKIKQFLLNEGITVLPLELPVGVLAEIVGDEDGPIVALRADIDALPVQEETGLPYASEIAGKMHACGHDFHTAAILGAAVLLKRHASKLRGKVRLLFQPAEEKGTGARAMIEAGALEGVEAIFGMHNKPELPVGTIGLSAGPLMASVDGFKIKVHGKGGHAAVPDAAIDPIVAASAIVGGIQTAVSRNTSPFDRAVVSICSFHAGTTWNVIPDLAVLDGTVRTFRQEVRHDMPDRLHRIAMGIAAGYGAEAELSWFSGIPTVNNDAAAVETVRYAAEALKLQVAEAIPSAGGEDFAHYQEKVPGCFIWMGTSGTEEWHHPKFTLNDEALVPSAALFALTAVHALEKDR